MNIIMECGIFRSALGGSLAEGGGAVRGFKMARWKEASLLYLAVFSGCCIASSCTSEF